MITTREYRTTDYENLLNLINELQDYGVSIDPIKRVRRGERYGAIKLQQILDNVSKQNGSIYIAEDDNQIVGFIVGFVLIQSEEALQEVGTSKTGYINRLYVKEKYRAKGVGTLLINELEKHFKKLGCDGIWVEADAYNPSAVNFYKQKGFIPREIHLLKKI